MRLMGADGMNPKECELSVHTPMNVQRANAFNLCD